MCGGVGSGVGGMCGPTVPPLTPLPVRLVEPPPLPSGAFPMEWYQGAPPCVIFFARDPPIWGMVCVVYDPNFARGSPLKGDLCGCGDILDNSRLSGAQPVGG